MRRAERARAAANAGNRSRSDEAFIEQIIRDLTERPE